MSWPHRSVSRRRSHNAARLRVEELESRTLLDGSGLSAVFIENTPNDPAFGSLYGLSRIRAEQAWDTTTGKPSVVVADIDSGIDYTHPDLYLNVYLNQSEIPDSVRSLLTDVDHDGLITFRDLNDPGNQGFGKITDLNGNSRIDAGDILKPASQGGWSDGSDGGSNGYVDDLIGWDFLHNDNDPLDLNGHGTHTAGTIGAIGNNALGVSGVNWQVSIMALQIIDANGTGSAQAGANAIRYAADNGARVSNNSWGVYGGSTGDIIYQAIAYAGTKNHLVIASAGNDGFNNDTSPFRTYPASYNLSNIISVTATDSNDQRPRWANYGRATVDLGAPGVNIVSTVPTSVAASGYAYGTGTSMAAPHVTGTAALLLSVNPNLTATQVRTMILSSTDPVSSLSNKTVTGGRLNAARALATNPNGSAPSGGSTSGGSSGHGGGANGTIQSGNSTSDGSNTEDPTRSITRDDTTTVVIIRVAVPVFTAPEPIQPIQLPGPQLIVEETAPPPAPSMRSPTYASGGSRVYEEELPPEEPAPDAQPNEEKPKPPATPPARPESRQSAPHNGDPLSVDRPMAAAWSEASALYFADRQSVTENIRTEPENANANQATLSTGSALTIALVLGGFVYHQPARRRDFPQTARLRWSSK